MGTTSSICERIINIVERFPSNHIVLVGDFNFPKINWWDPSPHGIHEETFLNAISFCDLKQLVREHTRPFEGKLPGSGSILDLVFTNYPLLIKNLDIIPGISDHKAVTFNYEAMLPPIHRENKCDILLYHKADTDAISAEIRAFSDSFWGMAHKRTLEENWICWKSKLLEVTYRHTPRRRATARKKPPWITHALKNEIAKKNRLLRKAKQSKSDKDWASFRQFRNETKVLLKKGYSSYVEHIFNETENGRKRFFKLLPSKRKEVGGIVSLRDNKEGPLLYDSTEKANLLAAFFQSVFTPNNDITENDPPGLKNIKDLKIPDMPLPTVSISGVEKQLLSLKPDKSMGPDGIHPFILKACAKELAPSLTYIIQSSLDVGDVPKDWLDANITPIYKAGDPTSPDNYRPVSLTSAVAKVAEHIIASEFCKHLERNDIICKEQHGFRKGHSPETQLLVLVNDWTQEIDKGYEVDVIAVDIAKAFDRVAHPLLLKKLEAYGIRSNLLEWFKAFLTKRRQRVVINGSSSTWYGTSSGVPQGSVLGPQLFLSFINDVGSDIQSKYSLFADDFLTYRTMCSKKDSKILQDDLNIVHTWTNDWKLPPNRKKSEHLCISRKRNKNQTCNEYFLNGEAIPKVIELKHVGVTITEDLSWNTHIRHICGKANQALGMVRRNLKGCSQGAKELAYKSIVRPRVEFASAVWDPSTAAGTHMLEMTQRRSARFVTGIPMFSQGAVSVTAILHSLKWPSLAERRKKRRLLLLHSVIYGHCKAMDSLRPALLSESYKRTTARNKHDKMILLEQFKTNARRDSFLPRTARDWNNLKIISNNPSDFLATV